VPTKNFLSFKEHVLLDEPIKIDIIHNCDDFFVINKPNYIHLDDSAGPNNKNIITALREKKPDAFYKSVYPLETDISGCSIIATHREALELLRNAYGSAAMVLRFRMICKSSEHLDDEILCELPLAKHSSKLKAIISRNAGKKAQTKFRLIERIGNFSIYEASCNYLRYHQLRIHGAHCGLKILGEDIYDDLPVPNFGDFKKIRPGKKTAAPLFNTQCIHLEKIIFDHSIYGNEISFLPIRPKTLKLNVKS
jgi:23S rRNA-/tRNA-specific pseudouridylate synthase